MIIKCHVCSELNTLFQIEFRFSEPGVSKLQPAGQLQSLVISLAFSNYNFFLSCVYIYIYIALRSLFHFKSSQSSIGELIDGTPFY